MRIQLLYLSKWDSYHTGDKFLKPTFKSIDYVLNLSSYVDSLVLVAYSIIKYYNEVP
jgi:hypothetical protein